MKSVKQISVFMANEPGALSKLTRMLAVEKINVEAFMVSDTIDHAVVRMVVDRPELAMHLLGDAGILCVENEVLALELPNRPGLLNELAARLGKARVNIEYAYGSAGGAKAKGVLVLRVRDVKRAAKVLGKK